MARIRLDLPETVCFETQLEIGIGAINYGHHLAHDAALTLCHEARVRFLAALGYSEFDVEGLAVVVSDAALVYKAEAFWGERLRCTISIGDFNPYGCDLYYRLTRIQDDRDIVHAKTGLVFFDREARKLAALPSAFLAKVQSPVPTTQP
jgi:4-hydroxybenzoyl-CoA thioesterase